MPYLNYFTLSLCYWANESTDSKCATRHSALWCLNWLPGRTPARFSWEATRSPTCCPTLLQAPITTSDASTSARTRSLASTLASSTTFLTCRYFLVFLFFVSITDFQRQGAQLGRESADQHRRRRFGSFAAGPLLVLESNRHDSAKRLQKARVTRVFGPTLEQLASAVC